MKIFQELHNNKLPSVKNGFAKNTLEFFKKTIEFQFKNIENIKKIHLSILDYLDSDSPVFFLRLYGSYSKSNYHLQRRGFLSEYKEGTKVSFCDNTFTLLFAGMKLAGLSYTSEDLQELFNQRKLIVGFGQVSEEKELSYYSPKGAKRANINAKGWYQAHIKPTGYGYGEYNLTELFPNPKRELYITDNRIRQVNSVLTHEQKKILKAHFLRLIHPFNSFLVPKRNHLEYDGINIGEESELINLVCDYIKNLFPIEYKEFDELSIKYESPKSYNSINEIKWFENPKNKATTSKKKYPAKSFKPKINVSDIEGASDLNIEIALRAIGKEIYATVLYPEISKNFSVTHYEISDKHKRYNEFTENSQRSRLSKAKSIFRAGLEVEALINVYESNKVKNYIKGEIEYMIKKVANSI